MGHRQYMLHQEMDVPLVENQQEMSRLQADFLIYAQAYWGPDQEDLPDTSGTGTAQPGRTQQRETTTDISKMKEW